MRNLIGDEPYSKAYLARCVKELKAWGAPLDGWQCVDIVDVREDDRDAPLSTCELCGCANVRYEHHMDHPLYFETVRVGCVCAGIMEGDILKARERERMARNRSKRRRNFVKKRWKEISRGMYTRRYQKQSLFISVTNDGYAVSRGNRRVTEYKGRKIDNMLSAMYAAFDLADRPIKRERL